MLLACKSMFWHATSVLDRLYSAHIEVCKYKLSSIVGKAVESFNEHNICNSILLSLTENFDDATLLPLLYYLIAGLPGLMMYKTTDLADSMLGNFKSINKAVAPSVCKIDSILAAYPCFGLLIAILSMKQITSSNMGSLLKPQG